MVFKFLFGSKYRNGDELDPENPTLTMPYPKVNKNPQGGYTQEQYRSYIDNIGKFNKGLQSDKDSTMNDLQTRKNLTPNFLLENPGNCIGGQCINNTSGTIAQMFGLPVKQATGNATFYDDVLTRDKNFKVAQSPKPGDVWQKVPESFNVNGKIVDNTKNRAPGGTNRNHASLIIDVGKPDINTGLMKVDVLDPFGTIKDYSYNPNEMRFMEYNANILRPIVKDNNKDDNKASYKNKRAAYLSEENKKKIEEMYSDPISSKAPYIAGLMRYDLEGLSSRYRLPPEQIIRAKQYAESISHIETENGQSTSYKMKEFFNTQNHEGRSVGVAQVKLNSIDPDVREFYGIKTQEDLVKIHNEKPEVYQNIVFHKVLSDASNLSSNLNNSKFKHKSSGLNKDNVVEYALYQYQGKNPLNDFLQEYKLGDGSYPMKVITHAGTSRSDSEKDDANLLQPKYTVDYLASQNKPNDYISKLYNERVSKNYKNDVITEAPSIQAQRRRNFMNLEDRINTPILKDAVSILTGAVSKLSDLSASQPVQLIKRYANEHGAGITDFMPKKDIEREQERRAIKQGMFIQQQIENAPSKFTLPGGQQLEFTPQMKQAASSISSFLFGK